MRLRRIVFWLLFLGALGWAGQAITLAGWSYFVAQEVVERALREVAARHRWTLGLDTQRGQDEVITDSRSAILREAWRHDLPLQEVNVYVTSSGISANVKWSYPVVIYAGRDILVIPMSLQRSIVPSR